MDEKERIISLINEVMTPDSPAHTDNAAEDDREMNFTFGIKGLKNGAKIKIIISNKVNS